MILHHYPMSPFSEKIRLIFGYADIEWLSVISPESPPRPIVEPLVGGYRRIPVAQSGADIFCDSRLIADEIASLAGQPTLSPFAADATESALADEYEGDIFWAAITSIPPSRVLGKLFRELPFTQALRFLRDRAGVARHARRKPIPGKRAVPMFEEHLQQLEDRLGAGGPFLAGGNPSHLDFAAVHTLWFKIVVGGLPMPAGLPRVAHWYEQLMAFGHGTCHPGAGEDAFMAAREGSPREVPQAMLSDARVGQKVRIAPADYALDATEGILVGIDQRRCVLVRETTDFGKLHLHFPLAGFELETI
jgi:glutathione S-transferase